MVRVGTPELWASVPRTTTEGPARRAPQVVIPAALREALADALSPDDARRLEQHIKNGGTVKVFVHLS